MTEWRERLRRNWSLRRLTGGRVQTGRTVFIRPLLERTDRASVPGPWHRLRRQLVERVLAEVDRGLQPAPVGDPRLGAQLREVMDAALREVGMTFLSPAERHRLEQSLASELYGLGPLDELIHDQTVSDILVNGPHDVWVDRHGRLEKTRVRFEDEEHLLRLLSRLTAAHGRHIEEASPHVDVRLADGSRLHAMIPPLTAGGPVLAIRRARAVPLRMDQLEAAGTLTPTMTAFLEAAVRAGLNILISGGASTGKTTLLNILAGFIPSEERVVTIEETAELRLAHPHVVALETRLPNVEGRGEVTMRVLVRNALRMRADRIIVGEVRGAEVFDMLQAMNIGHSGSLTTVHANGPDDALRRLATLALTAGADLSVGVIQELIGTAFHLVVHMRRFPNGTRRIESISEVRLQGQALATTDLFRLTDQGEHQFLGERPAFLNRLFAVRPDLGRLWSEGGDGPEGTSVPS